LNVREVRANAKILARAIVSDNRDQIGTFLADPVKANFFLTLDELPTIEDATVDSVRSGDESGEITCLICLRAPDVEFVLRTVWIQAGTDLAVGVARFFEWGLKPLSPSSASLDLHSFPSKARR
jgi:hypothetical protein